MWHIHYISTVCVAQCGGVLCVIELQAGSTPYSLDSSQPGHQDDEKKMNAEQTASSSSSIRRVRPYIGLHELFKSVSFPVRDNIMLAEPPGLTAFLSLTQRASHTRISPSALVGEFSRPKC